MIDVLSAAPPSLERDRAWLKRRVKSPGSIFYNALIYLCFFGSSERPKQPNNSEKTAGYQQQ
jgi:hypothetical protein